MPAHMPPLSADEKKLSSAGRITFQRVLSYSILGSDVHTGSIRSGIGQRMEPEMSIMKSSATSSLSPCAEVTAHALPLSRPPEPLVDAPLVPMLPPTETPPFPAVPLPPPTPTPTTPPPLPVVLM